VLPPRPKSSWPPVVSPEPGKLPRADLVLAQAFRRLAKMAGEPRNVLDVGSLRVEREITDPHVRDHTAAKWGHCQLLCETNSATWRHRIVSRLSCQARISRHTARPRRQHLIAAVGRSHGPDRRAASLWCQTTGGARRRAADTGQGLPCRAWSDRRPSVMLGANVGTTLIVQLLSFDLSALSPALILIGVLMFRRGHSSRTHDLGRVAIGLGLTLLALHQLLGLGPRGRLPRSR
jgi:Na+/Pi-cotransporter